MDETQSPQLQNQPTGQVKLIDKLASALEAIQWQAELGFWEEGGCGECGAHGPEDEEPHAEDCPVGLALNEYRRLKSDNP